MPCCCWADWRSAASRRRSHSFRNGRRSGASVPWRRLALLLGTIAVVGLVAGWLATRSALRAPIVPALRGD